VTDRWAQWLLTHRFGGDPAACERMLPQLLEFRDNVLRGAQLQPGDVVLDVGCGDGLLGVGALHSQPSRVIFSDVSRDLLDRCRETIDDARCEFVQTGLPGLEEIETASVDVAMTRSVLIYVPDKAASFAALHRVLRPGGRLSIFEPINSFEREEPPHQLWGFDITGAEELGAKVKAVRRQYDTVLSAMVDFDERDLLAWATAAGFTEVHLDYRAAVALRRNDNDWAAWLRHAPNPLVPTFAEVLAVALTPRERVVLEEAVRARRESPTRRASAGAYLTARR
jgi:arsenite methyltransferase